MSRDLSAILLDLEQTNRERTEADHALQLRPNDEEAEQEFSRLDDRLDELRDEFKARFLELTGVAWSNVDAAICSAAL